MARDSKVSDRKTGVAAWNESAGISTRSAASRTSRRNKAAADRKRRTALLVALLVVCVASIVCAWPVKERIARGLWLKGGTAYTMTATQDDGSKPTADQLSQAVSQIQSRLGASGISEYSVHQKGDDSIVIDLPDTVDGEGVAQLIGGSGQVQFVRVDEIGDADALDKVNAGTKNVELAKGTYTAFMDGDSVSSASVEDAGTGTYAVRIVFNEDGAQTFADVTRELAEETGRIAIVVDGHVMSAPSVSQEIEGGEVYITGDFTREEASALKAALDGETIPLDITYSGSEKVGPLVGKTLLWGMVGVFCLAFVGITVLAYRQFRTLAVLVSGAMAVYGVLMMGLMALASRLDMFILTIPGVVGGVCAAALVTVSSWLVAGRFQARVLDGKTIRGAAVSAPSEGLQGVKHPCAIASVAALVLLFVPMPALRDFGLVLVFGIICGIATTLWYVVTLLRLLAADAIQKKPDAWGVGVPAVAAEASGKES